MSNLTCKEKAFVQAYCSTAKFNAAEAAREAGYSEKTARVKGSQLLTKVNIQDYIQSFMSKATKKALLTTEDVVNGLLTEAQYNGEGSSQSARVAAWKALSDYTGGFDVNKQKVDHTSSDGSMTPSKIELVVATNDNKED